MMAHTLTRRASRAVIRHQQIARQWRLLLRLADRPRGLTFTDLAEEPSVTARTIRRDIDALRLAGFYVVVERDRGGLYVRLLHATQVARLAACRRPDVAPTAGN